MSASSKYYNIADDCDARPYSVHIRSHHDKNLFYARVVRMVIKFSDNKMTFPAIHVTYFWLSRQLIVETGEELSSGFGYIIHHKSMWLNFAHTKERIKRRPEILFCLKMRGLVSSASQLVSNIDPGIDNNKYTYSPLEQNIENHSKAFMFNFSPKKSFVLKCITAGIYMPWGISKLSIDHSHYYMLYDNHTRDYIK